MKRILRIICILLSIFFICLLVNYFSNESMIEDYNNGVYGENKLAVLGFTEPYIAHYNQGNVYYKAKEYDKAVKEYEKALESNPPHDRECLIRINLALAMIAPIDIEKVTPKEVEDTIEILEGAKSVLYEQECATEEGDGHNREAQTLADEIDELEKLLKEDSDPDDGGEDDPEEKETETETQDLKEEKNKQQQLEEIQRQAAQERESELAEIEQLNEFSFYSGKTY